mmetsp:Transcript_884/g.1386  ORF Transcript_884/g.1386 Transcript_884/m.1386 type:complete len:419 (-) Transcript_884:38-1294(-)
MDLPYSPYDQYDDDDDNYENDYGYEINSMEGGLVGSVSEGPVNMMIEEMNPQNSFSGQSGSLSKDKSPNGHDMVTEKILLMGLRKSGKSSIQKVVFQKTSPQQTLFLESTNKIEKQTISNNSFVQFQIWDFPGQINFLETNFDSDLFFDGCGALVFVIDAQDDYRDAIDKLFQTVSKAYEANKNIRFEVFIHKVDGLSEDHRMEIRNEIQSSLSDELQYHDLYDKITLRYHLTSIYNHTIFDAFSRVIQKLVKQLPNLQSLLTTLSTACSLEKTFLFDVVSKIYIATDKEDDASNSHYEQCADMIDVVLDISSIYGSNLSDDDSSPSSSLAYDEETSATIHLSNNTILYLREVNKYLALVCIIRQNIYSKIGLINYNLQMFRKGLQQLFEAEQREKSLAFQRSHPDLQVTSPSSTSSP